MGYQDDLTDDISRWLPDEGWHDMEIVEMEEGTSKKGFSKFTLFLVSVKNYGDGLIQDLTNIQGKRWLLRQLLEVCGIEPKENEEGRKIYDWDIPDIEGKTISVNIQHDKTPFIDRDGNERVIPKAKVIGFRKLQVT